MRARKPLLAGLLVALLTVSLTPVGPVAAQPPGPTLDPPPAAAQATDPSRTVTLVTGDRVALTGDGGVVVHRGEGRDHITHLVQRVGDQLYVIPSDAAPLLATGELDRRLFDVALLQEIGYHDGARPDLPLIVTTDAPATTTAVVPDEGVTVVRDLPAIDGAAVRVDKSGAGEFWDEVTEGGQDQAPGTLAAGVSTVWLDGLRQPLLDQSVPQIGAPAAHDAGLDGSGVTVAVLDTGIDATHPDLADRIVGQENFTEGLEDDRDLVGHGTHVASTLAGTGAASDGQYQGVAPGAGLLDGKVCVEFGCAESWILAGMQWAAEQGAVVVNVSLGGPPFEDDPLVAAVEQLTDEYGVLFVIAAGNSGPASTTVDSPGVAGAALTVGAVEKDDEIAFFSSRGPTLDGTLKPDLTAPGSEIVAANSADGFLGQPGQSYTTLSGTSMATPHAAGAAAILAQQHPDWSAEQLKAALMASAAPHPDLAPYTQGAGRLDVARAIGQEVTSSPASVSFDRPLWPHDDDEPQSRTVTYQNAGADDVTLELAMTATGPEGAPAPAGFFAVSEASVTVPAGGTAEVSIAVDTSVGEVDGLFGGYLTASGPDELVVTTPFAVDREVESYDVTLVHTDRDGAPATDYFTLLLGGDPFRFVDVFGEPEVTVRLAVGEYFLGSFVSQETAEDQFETTLLVLPRLAVSADADRTVAVDARLGEPVTVGVPDRAAVPTYAYVDATFLTDEFGVGMAVIGGGPEDIYTARLGPPGPLAGLNTTVGAGFAVPPADGDLAASRTVYDVAWSIEDDFATGFTREVERQDLATVRADHARQVDGSEGAKGALALVPDIGGLGLGLPLSLPLTRTEHYNTDGGVEWVSLFDEVLITDEDFETVIVLDGEPTVYQAGRTYHERWNYGVFGPVLASDFSGVLRLDNELLVVPDLYGDGAGHWGWSPSAISIAVYQDGELVLTEPEAGFAFLEVPPEPARYRVEVEAERLAPAPLSSRTSLAWEFDSAHVDDETVVQLPVSVVRFSPNLAPDNTARAGRPMLVPVSVDAAPASDAGRVRSLSVEVSFDDGDTWRPAPVLANRYVLVWHPRGDGFVSLRAAATDRAGNTVEQTIIRAYQIR